MYREIIKAHLSEQTRKIRRELGLSQEQMSKQLQITTRSYGDLERGRYYFSEFVLLFPLGLPGKERADILYFQFAGMLRRQTEQWIFRKRNSLFPAKFPKEAHFPAEGNRKGC